MFVGNQTFIFVFAQVLRLFTEGNHPEDGTAHENVNIPETLMFHSLSSTVYLTAVMALLILTIDSWVQRMVMGVKLNWLSVCAEGIVLGPFLRTKYFHDISIAKHELDLILFDYQGKKCLRVLSTNSYIYEKTNNPQGPTNNRGQPTRKTMAGALPGVPMVSRLLFKPARRGVCRS